MFEFSTETLHGVHDVYVGNLVCLFGVHHQLVQKTRVVQADGEACEVAGVQFVGEAFSFLVQDVGRVVQLFDLGVARRGLCLVTLEVGHKPIEEGLGLIAVALAVEAVTSDDVYNLLAGPDDFVSDLLKVIFQRLGITDVLRVFSDGEKGPDGCSFLANHVLETNVKDISLFLQVVSIYTRLPLIVTHLLHFFRSD